MQSPSAGCGYGDAVDRAPGATGSASPARDIADGLADAAVTAVVIPVREAETIVRQRLLQVRPSLLPRDHGVAAHITLCAPFLPPERIDDGVISELAHWFADLTSFPYSLTEVAEFPDGVVYLAPEPALPFTRLSLELRRLFPETTALGAFDEFVPHVTVPLAPEETVDDLREHLRRSLPVTAHAVEAALVHVEEGNTHVIANLPFGASAA
jgi:2'-5' RNA ligase